MSEEMKFFMYLLEYYSSYKNKETSEVLNEWEEHGITNKIYNNYWTYHTESMENAYADIDSMLKNGKPAW